jgi:hypothetical protein
MALNARFVPILSWPGAGTPPARRERSRFKSSYAKTLALLERELGRIQASHVLIQAWFRADQIRNDGWPYARATPRDVGVILTFTRGGQVVSMPCDRFDSFDDNLRAIGLSLEALRMVDRYGVTRNGEQYRGFTSLPSAAPAAEDLDSDLELLARLSGLTEGELRRQFDALRTAYTVAARKTHPDLGGSKESFSRTRRAYERVARACHSREV